MLLLQTKRNDDLSSGCLRLLLFQLRLVAAVLLLAPLPVLLAAQPTPANYERALDINRNYRGLVDHLPGPVQWIEATDRFVYRRTVPGGYEFVAVDAQTQTARPAFDHARLAAVLSKALGEEIKPEALPFEELHLEKDGHAFRFLHGRAFWRCDLDAYTCEKASPPGGFDFSADDDGGYDSTPKAINGAAHGVKSPDGKWLAFVENYNLAARPADAKPDEAAKQTAILSEDGSEGNYYSVDTIKWSPDSKHVLVCRIRPGYRRVIHYVESSPADQLQPEYSTMVYPKPGDVLPLFQPVLFAIGAKQELPIDNTLFPNPYELTNFAWRKDSRSLTFEYNQRGHQVYRVIDVDAASGKARTLIEETSRTFINYEPLTRDQYDHGKYFRYDVADGKQIVWASERDGWEHLYLFNGQTGALEGQITRGDWVVRAVDRVDESHREIYFEASGMNPGENPYYVHGYKIGFDGAGLAPLSPAEADHTLSYSSDGKY